ncbi:MAG TPA: polysaccharide lyase family protein [Acidobacteriaceae bacterium]|nr:polysaccharide lyase family protein [Acidobacteriaceae bacterium]
MIAKRSAVFFSALLMFVPSLFVHAATKAQDATVFQIGTFDRSSNEFPGGTTDNPVNFIVGKSDPAKDWYAMQNVVVPSTGAQTSSPRTIRFVLSSAPSPSYEMRLAFLIESNAVPAIRVVINGKTGTFYLHPQLDFRNGDQWDSFYPAYSHADVTFRFPGNYLHNGENIITLQPVENKHVADGTLTYDAVALTGETTSFHPSEAATQIVPTIFYKQVDGQLNELVDVFIRHNEPITHPAEVDLKVDGKTFHHTIQGDSSFGEDKLEFQIPVFPAGTKAEVAWFARGKKSHYEATLTPQKKWTLYLVPHIHLDIGYSDYQAKIAAIHSRVIDEAMEMMAEHPDFRFSLDGAWPLQQFMETRTPAQQQNAVKAMHDQQLFVPANYANLLSGFPTAETLLRSLYPSANFSREHGTPFNYATMTDVPSWSWSYASILASAGIHDLFGGSNNYRAPVLLQGRLDENSPVWWQGPDGQKVLLWYSRIYQQMQMLFGLPPELAAGEDTLPLFMQQYQHPGYHADAAILYGSQVENTDLFPSQSTLAAKWNSAYAYPRIEYSGFHHALESIAAQFGSDIPTIRGDGGPYWEDGIASDAYYAAMERQNEDRAPSAEKLATLTSLVNPLVAANKPALDRMWTNMVLMDEHTWDSSNSVSQPAALEAVKQLAIKDQYAVNAKAEVDFIATNSMASLVNSISAKPGSLVVFNTLNWERSGPVVVDLDNGDEIVDAKSGRAVPVEVLASHDGFDRVRFVAQNVPAVGYKIYSTRHAPKGVAAPQTEQATTIESPYYRVTLDPTTGAIRSIFDKELQRELVNQQSPYRFGQYLYVTGADKAPNSVLQYSTVYPKPNLDVHPASDGSLVSVVQTPNGWVARLKSSDLNAPSIRTEVRLFDREKKIEIVENLDKKKVYSKEAAYFAFPFAMSHPEFQYEIQTGVVDPARDMYPGAGHEWFSAQHWASVQQDGASGTVMPLDASLITLGDIFRGDWPTQFGARPGTIFSYIMDNYWDTNYAAGQGGHFRFRYVITSAGSTDPAALSRMGWEDSTPLEVDTVTTQDKALQQPQPLNGTQDSFLKVEDPDLLLETWKPAEDGNGTILRFLDIGGVTRTVSVTTPLLNLVKAWQTNAVERNQKSLSLVDSHSFQFTVHSHELVTIRLVGSDVLKPPSL